MLIGNGFCILAFNFVSFNCGVYGLDWPWNWKRKDSTCYTTCLAAFGTVAVVATPLAISALGFGAAGGVAVFPAALPIGVVNAGNWFGTMGKMTLVSTVSPLCAAICGSKEEDLKCNNLPLDVKQPTINQSIKCNTHRINGMKGLDENLIKAEKVNNIEKCEGLCNDEKDCRAFRYLSKNSLCFVYNLQRHIEDDINESQFYVKRCVLCYMNTMKNAKGRDDEIESIWEESSLKECENKCIKSDDCRAVHFDGDRCFKFNDEVKPYKKTGIHFSRKICVHYTD